MMPIYKEPSILVEITKDHEKEELRFDINMMHVIYMSFFVRFPCIKKQSVRSIMVLNLANGQKNKKVKKISKYYFINFFLSLFF